MRSLGENELRVNEELEKAEQEWRKSLDMRRDATRRLKKGQDLVRTYLAQGSLYQI